MESNIINLYSSDSIYFKVLWITIVLGTCEYSQYQMGYSDTLSTWKASAYKYNNETSPLRDSKSEIFHWNPVKNSFGGHGQSLSFHEQGFITAGAWYWRAGILSSFAVTLTGLWRTAGLSMINSRWTNHRDIRFGHAAEFATRFRDLHVVIGRLSSGDYQLRAAPGTLPEHRDSCKRCNTCPSRKPFIAVLSLPIRKSRFVTSMVAGLCACP